MVFGRAGIRGVIAPTHVVTEHERGTGHVTNLNSMAHLVWGTRMRPKSVMPSPVLVSIFYLFCNL